MGSDENKGFVYEFGRFVLSPLDKTLFADGVPLRLPAKEIETLLLLVEHNGRALSKEQIMSAIWHDAFVEEGNLVKQISRLRKVLESNGEQYIATVPKHGYRFSADVKRELVEPDRPVIAERRIVERITFEVENQPEPNRLVTRERSINGQNTTLAVLPFINVSSDPENDFFCDGLAEELLNYLGRINDLRVVARTSAFSFKNKDVDVPTIARLLNVESILEGSVRKSGDRLRINIQLVNANDGYQIWSQIYDRKVRDIFDLQEDIALAVVGALNVKLRGQERNRLSSRSLSSHEAYELYLKGRHFWNKRTDADLNHAVSFYERAIEIDPNFALAHAGLADAYVYLGYAFGTMPPTSAMPKARAGAIRAQELDPLAAEPHTSLAMVHLFYDWDWTAAEKEWSRAAALNPNYPTNRHFHAVYLATIERRFDTALAEAKFALDLDPLSLPLHNIVGVINLQAGNFIDAISMWQKMLELDPTGSYAHNEMGWAYELYGLFEKAADEYALALDASNEPEASRRLREIFANDGIEGLRRSKIEYFLEKWEQRGGWHGDAYSLAVNYARLGDKESTLEWLERAFTMRSGLLVWLNIQPAFDFLRLDPAFLDITSRIGLPEKQETFSARLSQLDQ